MKNPPLSMMPRGNFFLINLLIEDYTIIMLFRVTRVLLEYILQYYHDSRFLVRYFIIYLSMIHPLNCMFSGHLIQRVISN